MYTLIYIIKLILVVFYINVFYKPISYKFLLFHQNQIHKILYVFYDVFLYLITSYRFEYNILLVMDYRYKLYDYYFSYY
ncbi:protein of unknown function [Ruminococcaceae bacterium BL-6]|nr:protein of unknown function [Ruminococcaceae bacterium BL-6]